MATNNGKVTTTTATLRALGKEVNASGKANLNAWLAVYDEFVRSGGGNKQSFARALAQHCDWTADSIRVNISRIATANEVVKGGARACLSMDHLRKSIAPATPKQGKAPARKVSTVTISEADARKRLAKRGFSERDIKDIISSIFVG